MRSRVHRTGRRVIKVAVIPPVPAFSKNALFARRRHDDGSHSPNTHWMDCFAAVYRLAREADMIFGTADILPIDEADVAIYMAQPPSPSAIAEDKRARPRLKSILVLPETALGARYMFNRRNHEGCDAIFTYNDLLVDHRRYFPFPPRAYDRDRIRVGRAFEARRVGCLVGTNRPLRFRSGLFAMRKGWKFSLQDWVDYAFCPGELITYRTSVGRQCARYEPGTFDIYGEGWDADAETKAVCRGIPTRSTLDYIGEYRYYFAFENHASDCSLISERIWDALWGDAVPVYMGHTRIADFIPRDCFVDATQFENAADLLDWLRSSPKTEWDRYRSAGRDFTRSKAIEPYLPESFARQFLETLTRVVRGTSAASTA